MAVPTVITRTNIDNANDITFCNSPIHLRLQNSLQDNTIQSAIVYLWIWNGEQNKVLGTPNFTLVSDKISQSDKYINFEISDLIRSFLVSPSNAPNTNQPTFAYNELTNPTITGQGVFWQVITDITSTAGTVRNNYRTAFATLGWLWNYEQNALTGRDSFLTNEGRWYNPNIHNYISQSFNLTNPYTTATTANVITVSNITPTQTRCSKDSSLIVFINKNGLWDMFTPNGKFSVKSKSKDDTSNSVFRDPSRVDNSLIHSRVRENLEVTQSYIVNTGLIDESNAKLVEQILYSPKVYLIKFLGDRQTELTAGTTIDSTYITIDSLEITIDSALVTEEHLGFFKTHQQIPVIVTDNDFDLKTRINNKSAIDYNIKFDETNNKINSIR
jgi:hypothetical protein